MFCLAYSSISVEFGVTCPLLPNKCSLFCESKFDCETHNKFSIYEFQIMKSFVKTNDKNIKNNNNNNNGVKNWARILKKKEICAWQKKNFFFWCKKEFPKKLVQKDKITILSLLPENFKQTSGKKSTTISYLLCSLHPKTQT